MASRKVEELTSGMVLARDLADDQGHLLLTRGTVLEQRHIQCMSNRKVGLVDVVQPDSGVDCSFLAEKYLTRFFGAGNDDPLAAEVFRLGRLRLERLFGNGWIPPQMVLPKGPSAPDCYPRDNGTAQDLVNYEVQLAAFPDIYFKIRRALDSTSSTGEHIARVVSKDTSLTAKLLRLVNSPVYGFSVPIESITRAISLIGANGLSNLALGISALQAFKDIPAELIDMKAFWTHSIAVGSIARNIAGRIPGLPGERFFVGGMLHDIGRLLLFKNLPSRSTVAHARSRTAFLPLLETEREVLGFDHALVGSLLLKKWNLPSTLETLVHFHHDPANGPNRVEATVIHVADFIANGLQLSQGGSLVVPSLQRSSLEILGLEPGELEGIAAQAEAEIQEIMQAFLIT
jgi:HD-like signal output (HDOD) protein